MFRSVLRLCPRVNSAVSDPVACLTCAPEELPDTGHSEPDQEGRDLGRLGGRTFSVFQKTALLSLEVFVSFHS